MRRPQPSARTPLALHLAAGVPLIALAVWFGILDTVPLGGQRCASCGVEGYVTAAHLAAAAWLAIIVARVAAARRALRHGRAAPGGVTTAALAAVATCTLVFLVEHPLFAVPATVALLASLVLFPVGGIWWVLSAIGWSRRPAASERELTAGSPAP